MRPVAALCLALAAADEGRAATAYVTDEIILGVYAQQNTSGPRLATLHSGAAVDTLAVSGDSTQIRLADGVTGWVKSVYLTTGEPATVRLKQLQDELDRTRATSPMLAETPRNEVARLQQELAQQSQAGSAASGVSAATAPTGPAWPARPWMWWALSVFVAMCAGFWLGYAALARRIRIKFGGIKVY